MAAGLEPKPDGKRHLPVLSGGGGSADDGPVPERAWHWVPLGAILIVALAYVLLRLALPLATSDVLDDVFGGEVPEDRAAALEGLARVPTPERQGLVTRMVATSALVLVLAAAIAGGVIGRLKRSTGLAEPPLAALLAALFFAVLARSWVSILPLAPLMALAALGGGVLGRRWRRGVRPA